MWPLLLGRKLLVWWRPVGCLLVRFHSIGSHSGKWEAWNILWLCCPSPICLSAPAEASSRNPLGHPFVSWLLPNPSQEAALLLRGPCRASPGHVWAPGHRVHVCPHLPQQGLSPRCQGPVLLFFSICVTKESSFLSVFVLLKNWRSQKALVSDHLAESL